MNDFTTAEDQRAVQWWHRFQYLSGPVVRGGLLVVVGAFGEASADVHSLLAMCAA